MAEEIELKLTVAAATLAAVRAHPAIAAVASGRLRSRPLVSAYYDTPEHDLAAAGVALRLRRAGTRWLQTVKGEGVAAAGLHRRAEFEWSLAAPRLDLAKLAQTPWRKLFARTDGRYRRVFVTAVRRSELPLTFADGTRATLCLDSGEIRAGRRRLAVHEIEVEIEHGDAAAPVRVGRRTRRRPAGARHAREQGGARLRARRRRRAPSRAGRARLRWPRPRRHGQHWRAIAADCIAQIEANAEAMLACDDAEYLHQLRVGWRRLRSLLQLAILLAPEEAIAPIAQELRWLGSILGPARDSDVFAGETLPEVAGAISRPARHCPPARARHPAPAAADRRGARSHRHTALPALAARARRVFRDPRSCALRGGSVPARARDWIGPVLQQRHDKLVKRARHIHRLQRPPTGTARGLPRKSCATPPNSSLRCLRASAARPTSTRCPSCNRFWAGSTISRLRASCSTSWLRQRTRRRARAYAAGIARGWLAASVAPELKRLRAAQRAFAQCAPFWTA